MVGEKMSEPQLIEMQTEPGVAVVSLEKGLYPLDVIYGASYVLIDRAYILLDKDASGRTLVRIESKDEATDEAAA